MALNREDPARHAAAAGSEMFLLGGWNSFENKLSALELQQRFLASRYDVRPDHARLIAELAFPERRAS
ncbi:conserved hypothetical protein [Methylocella tundrae]|uniref:Uncharacterized protein n=1 Tax=Methylocella tundrae TaxID=227605 RepID=A0A8B6MB21_METTU|nr:conserved hypothetical protein [Methylocella tundrae]VTZ52193.1 conserved hypothetical protein [Methylocella tundrae]